MSSCIFYYSKHCEICKRYLTILSRSTSQHRIHYICIDRRIRDPTTNKTYILLEGDQRIIMPDLIDRVPAVLVLDSYKILFGDKINQFLNPIQETEVRRATQENMEPIAFTEMDVSMSGGLSSGGIVSDSFSYLHQQQPAKPLEIAASSQMHSYADCGSDAGYMSGPQSLQFGGETTLRGMHKTDEQSSQMMMENRIKKLKEERDRDMRSFTGPNPLYSPFPQQR